MSIKRFLDAMNTDIAIKIILKVGGQIGNLKKVDV